MGSDDTGGVAAARLRAAKRHDVPALVDLRVRYLAEISRVDPRFRLLPDVRARVEHAMPVWVGQEDRVLLVAEAGGDGGPVVGYATGLVAVWPPVWKSQRVGEVSEVYVLPDRRGAGTGRELLRLLATTLSGRGVQVLRAPVPVKSEVLLARFRALGFAPVQYVMERNLEEA